MVVVGMCAMVVDDKGAMVVDDKGAMVVDDKSAMVVDDKSAMVVDDKGAMVVDDKGAMVVDDKGAMVVDDKAAQYKCCYVVDDKIADELRTLKLLCRDVHVRLQLIRTQYRHFSMVAEGCDLVARDKQLRRHRLGEGEALEEDQRAALDWEDRMAIRIQTCVRRKVGDVDSYLQWASSSWSSSSISSLL